MKKSQQKSSLLGLRAYARHRGCHLKSVQQAIEKQRISITIIEGKKLIDWKAADMEWAERTNPAYQFEFEGGASSEAALKFFGDLEGLNDFEAELDHFVENFEFLPMIELRADQKVFSSHDFHLILNEILTSLNAPSAWLEIIYQRFWKQPFLA